MKSNRVAYVRDKIISVQKGLNITCIHRRFLRFLCEKSLFFQGYFHRSGEFRLVDLISRAEGDAQTQRRVSFVVVSRKGLIT